MTAPTPPAWLPCDPTIHADRDAWLTGGNDSTLTGGDSSTLTWHYWDGKRYRLHTVYTGEDGIKANTPYIGRFFGHVFTVSEVTA